MSLDFTDRLKKNPALDKEKIAFLSVRSRRIPLARRPLVMGIVNINDDSFSGDGRLDARWALDRAREIVEEGADMVDVGGESARTNRPPVSEDEEWGRIAPFVREFSRAMQGVRPCDEEQIFPPLLSVNTWRTRVAARALESGCDLLNDMGGLPDGQLARLCAERGAALLIMHTKGEPKVSHAHVRYRDVLSEVEEFFESKIALAVASGMSPESLVLDPGIDFAKQTGDNLRIYRELSRFARFKCPILLPVSRKGTIGDVLGIPEPSERDAGTMACMVAGRLRGASIFRVHNVRAARLTLRALAAVQ